MLYLVMTASLQDVIESYEIALNISIRIRNTITYACLSCQIYNHRNLVVREDFLDNLLISNRVMNKRPVFIQCLDFFQTFIFDIHIIVICNTINTYYLDVLHIIKQTLYKIAADKSGSTCNKDCLTC